MIIIAYGKISDLNLSLWIKLNRLNLSIYRELLKIFKAHNLSTAQFAVLEVLYHKGSLSIQQIQEKILISGGNITLVVKNLESKNFLTVTADPEDKRRRIISITQKGKDILRPVFQIHLNHLNHMLSIYSQRDKEQLIHLLNKFLDEYSINN